MAELRIYDDIGYFGVTAASVAAEVDRHGPDPLDVRISSSGGNVFEGIAIHSVLARHPSRVTVYVDSVAASAASFIAMAGNEIVISPYARMMIHDASIIAAGNAREVRGIADMVDGLSATMAQMYADRAGGSPEHWRNAMLAETWYSATEAVGAGLADRIGTAPHAARSGDPVHRSSDASNLTQAVAIAAARRRRSQRNATPEKGNR